MTEVEVKKTQDSLEDRLAQVVDLLHRHRLVENLAHRQDDELIDALARDHIAYVPFFPLGGFSPLQSAALSGAAARLSASANQVALAWLLQRAPNILPIPGTTSLAHLKENIAAQALDLPEDIIADLDQARA